MKLPLLISVISLFHVLIKAQRPPITEFPRQAPFCVDDVDEPDLTNFKEIFDYHNNNPKRFIPVSPESYRSPTGFVKNFTLNRIYIDTKSNPDMAADHPYREFHNYFHITIKAADESEGFEGLFVQSISAPLGVPFGEFVTDFDCGDCGEMHKTSTLDSAIVPCSYKPAASFLQPVIFSVGGKANTPKKFREAHVHFRYVDYPCFDVTFAQFLIIAVRRFKTPPQYEIYYSPTYNVNIEGCGAPFPMYYGFEPTEIKCHHPVHSYMENWKIQFSQRLKVKYSDEFDKCTYNDDTSLLGANFCPPGPVTCSSDPPTYGAQWKENRENYEKRTSSTGTETICNDCGEWEDRIGVGTWPRPNITYKDGYVNFTEIYVTLKPIDFYNIDGSGGACNNNTERRNKFGKTKNDSRDSGRDPCPGSFGQLVATKGFHWGRNVVLTAHNVLMLFTWTVGSNCLIFCARFLKEASFAEKASGCFGIGKWLWEHIFWTYACILSMVTGVFMIIFLDQESICEIYDSAVDTMGCNADAIGHKTLGGVACLMFFMGFVSGWTRPMNRTLRDLVVYYHIISGYLAKYLGLFSMLNARILISKWGVIFIIVLEVSFIGFFIAATVIQYLMDKKMPFRVQNRRVLPVPEGIDTFSEPPMKNARALLFPFMIVSQLTFFTFGAFDIWKEKAASKF